MPRHLADHETPSSKDGLAHFLRISRGENPSFWKVLWKKGTPEPTNRRVVEYVRIDRGRSA
jgi:hypothetical protein